MIKSIQLLRLIAALGVVAAHWPHWALAFQNPAACRKALVCGSFGVDLFFIVSGFLMLVTTQHKPLGIRTSMAFITRRVLRIWPVYAVVTIAYMTARGTGFAQYLNSLLFVPHLSPMGFWDPALLVGWTLNFEMYFYLATAVCLLFPSKAKLAALIVASAGIFSILIDDRFYYTASIIVEFALGALLGILWQNRTAMASLVRFRYPILLGAIAAFFIATHGTDWVNPVGLSVPRMKVYLGYFDVVLPRFIGWGLPALFIAMTAMLFEDRIPLGLAKLGDYTYSLYLANLPVAWALETFALPKLHGSESAILLAFGYSLALCAVTYLTYWIVEVPTQRLGHAIAGRIEGYAKRPASAASPA